MRTRRPPMTPLRQRMVEDMQLRNFSAHTMRAYLHGVAAFAQPFHTSPEHLGPEHVRTYQLFLVQEKQRAWPTVVQTEARGETGATMEGMVEEKGILPERSEWFRSRVIICNGLQSK